MQTIEQLGQARPANTTAVSFLTVSSGQEKLVKTIFICNTSTASASFRLFHDDDGTTYDETTALYFDVVLLPNQTVEIECNIMIDNTAGNLAIRTSVASALTFTAYGSIIT